jgi:hypothetical protein
VLPLIALALFALALGVARCGSEESEGAEVIGVGEPVEVGALSITVLSSRYMDRTNKKDAAYLVGQPPAGAGLAWFGVFLKVENKSDRKKEVPAMTIRDAIGEITSAFPSENPEALQFGETLEPGEQLPKPDTGEQEDTSEGVILIFRIGAVPSQIRRPLTLHIEGFHGQEANVKLDLA